MYLVEIFLPKSNSSETQDEFVEKLKLTLTDKFGGVTSYLRQSAEGLWRNTEGEITLDRIGVLEVQVDELDEKWWQDLRKKLESQLKQEEVLIRASKIFLL